MKSSNNNSPELEKTRGSDRRLARQKGALDRFHLLDRNEWENARNPLKYPLAGTDAQYDDYVERKVTERNNLLFSIKASRRA